MSRVFLPLLLLLVAFALVQATRDLATRSRTSRTVSVEPTLKFDPNAPPADPAYVVDRNQLLPLRLTVDPGQTLGGVLMELGLEGPEARRAVEEMSDYIDPRRIKAGNVYSAYLRAGDMLERFEMRVRGKGRLQLLRDDYRDDWTVHFQEFERHIRPQVVRGEVSRSLETAIREAGGPGRLAFAMADVLKWDLDFTRDVRRGDRFEVLFEELYLDDELEGVGDVLAVRYENRGQVFEAYRYGDSEDYYNADGQPMKKMFLRSPMQFSRITSKFSKRRFHPVLKTYRPHYGVDYGAPVGTPVRVTANGTVTFSGWNKGGGKTIKVRHAQGYVTAYLHLSRFAKGISPGRRVRQGEVIGYVGSTGLASGPHLDYRVNLKGRWIDPLAIGAVPARALSDSEAERFTEWRDLLRASLDSGEPMLPAEYDPEMALQVARGLPEDSLDGGVTAAGGR